MEPLSFRFLLLEPTERPVTPVAMSQRCATTFQTEKSYRESWKVTVFVSPGLRYTESKPLRLNGAWFAEAGGDVYSCGTCEVGEHRWDQVFGMIGGLDEPQCQRVSRC